MKKLIFAAVAAASMLIGSSGAKAGNILFDPDGAGGVGATEINQIDYGVGNGLAVGGITAANNFVSGVGSTDFEFYFQSTIASASLVPGGSNALNGFTGELTVVGAITERVVFADFTPALSQGRAVFADALVQTANYFEIYYDPTPDADMLAGTGFNNGTKILSGNVSTKGTAVQNQFNTQFAPAGTEAPLDGFGGSDDYPGLVSQSGSGNSFIGLDVSLITWDPAFFPQLDEFTILDFNTSLIIPFTQTDPSGAFLTSSTTTAESIAPSAAGAGLGTATLGDVNGGLLPGDPRTNGTDFQVQIDSSGTVAGIIVPEPSSLLIFSLAIGSAGLARRRRKTAK